MATRSSKGYIYARNMYLHSTITVITATSLLATPSLATGDSFANHNASTKYTDISTSETIPDLWFSTCLNDLEGNPATPCIAYCRPEQPDCLTSASLIVNTCSPSWSSYFAVKWSSTSPGSGWSTITSTDGQDGGLSTETVSAWTSFSRANYSLVVGISTMSTLTPVYALGSPVLSISTTSYEGRHGTLTYLSGPTPTCRYTAVATSTDCGQCTLTGGTVQLFYWPPTTTTHPTVANETTRSGSIAPYTSLLNGTTLYSPSVYISFETVYASNNCFQVGSRHISTMLALDSQDISTQVHIGGKVGQYGANSYSALRYGDLTDLPPASEYELQPSCLMLGCPAIYPSSWNPVLAVPRQLRSMDPAWQGCAMGLEGLYDPPVALTPQAALAEVTTPVSVVVSTATAVPGSMQNTGVPMATSLSAEPMMSSRTLSLQDSAAATAGVGSSAGVTVSLPYDPLATAAFSRPTDGYTVMASAGINTASGLASAASSVTKGSMISESSDTRLLSAVGVVISGLEPTKSSFDPARPEITGHFAATIPVQTAAGVTASSQASSASVSPSENGPFVTISHLEGQSEGSVRTIPGTQLQTASSTSAATTVRESEDPEDDGATASIAISQPWLAASTTTSELNGDAPSTAASSTTLGASGASSTHANAPITNNMLLSSSYSAQRSAASSATRLQGNTTTALPVWAGASPSAQLSVTTRSTDAIGGQSHASNSIASIFSLPSSACHSVNGQLAGVLAALAAVFWVVYSSQT
ncbi:hypothetical protein LTS01_014666 [Friedmanniomyces endolithicus]|nr:hypothetical protein LTS01_014666 [Friedmanniomyces endolithicus]